MVTEHPSTLDFMGAECDYLRYLISGIIQSPSFCYWIISAVAFTFDLSGLNILSFQSILPFVSALYVMGNRNQCLQKHLEARNKDLCVLVLPKTFG
ncbi:zinc finger protein 138 isoform X8 [Homo sapiens]|uniref:zinc finger protein 138 isoform X8 n=2 Tax=Homo sapiens TaxID=9606 RepID=UPI001FB0BA2A|nr:zinc finger protein 138 isoform X8 [Homo sapiens]